MVLTVVFIFSVVNDVLETSLIEQVDKAFFTIKCIHRYEFSQGYYDTKKMRKLQ